MQLMVHAHLGNVSRPIFECYGAVSFIEARKLVRRHFDSDGSKDDRQVSKGNDEIETSRTHEL